MDFENAKPTSAEMKLHTKVAKVLREGEAALKLLTDYKGCQELARAAMSQPTPESETAAFEGLLKAVDSISVFFRHSRALENVLPELLDTISQPPAGDQKDAMADMQALCKQLADIFDFTLRFDQTRMKRPHLSNDFSYYRRLLPKFSNHPGIKVTDDEASGMALFTAEHIPMMTCLSKGASQAYKTNQHVTTTLCVMANSCMKMVKSKKFSRPETNLFCARAMTGSIVLYDHVDPLGGAFYKKCPINLKGCIMMLKKEFSDEMSLLNAIRYSTKTFNSASASIQDMFD